MARGCKMKNKLVSTILLSGIAVIMVSSFYVLDSKFVFAQTPDNSDPGAIPEDNSTDINTGPIPEDNITDTTSIPNPMDNSTDIQNLNPVDSNPFTSDNMSMPDNSSLPVNTPTMPPNNKITLPPLEQIKSGIHAKDVQCKQGFSLVIKAEDGSPACVEPQIVQILIQRGW